MSAAMLPAGPVRIKFEKRGSLKFISHLDLQRMMNTAFNRAEIPIWYTEGFNPHKKLIFALPLPLGAESICEFLDFRIVEPMSSDELTERLNAAFPPQLRVFESYTPESKFQSIGWAEYELSGNSVKSIDPAEALKAPVVVLKRTKSGEKEADISQFIKRAEIENGVLRLVLCADQQNYLNPDYPAKYMGLEDYSVMRRRLFLKDSVTEFK
ncbi:MAG: DUF2344 domain-containing protein [Clostridiales bacterium]|jgi:radical SAM-linked protein|nr:DUF2344 domain-containing protein [Clostridiales bacterium]